MNFSEVGEWLARLLPGLGTSIQLIVVVVLMAIPFAILLALGARSTFKPLSWLNIALVEIGRGVPALVMLYLVFFGIPSLGILVPAFWAAAIGLALNLAAYTSEVIGSALDAVPVGQREAAAAIGISQRITFFKVILPQATKIASPALVSWIISFFQATALAFAIAVPELMMRANEIAALNFKYLEVFGLAGLLYALISIPGSRLVNYLEKKQESSI